MAAQIIRILWQRSLGIVGRDSLSAPNHRDRGADSTTRVATGTIAALRNGDFGFIVRDAPSDRNDLFFHRSRVAEDGFDNLQVGQRVSFREEPDPHDHNRRRAIGVQPVDGDRVDATSGATPGR